MAATVGPIQIKRGTSSQWADSNVPLRSGELGYDTTRRRMKIGDGGTLWEDLAWANVDQGTIDHIEALAVEAGQSKEGAQDALADAREVADEIPGRVQNAIDGLDVLAAESLDSSEVIFGVIDEGGRRLWIESAPDGGPTSYARDKIGLPQVDESASDVIGGILDANDRRTELVVNARGEVPARVLEAQRRRAGVPLADPEYPVQEWAVWGDSMSASGWVALLAGDLGFDVYGGGLGSQGTRQITARANGVPLRVSVPNGVLPASGQVTATLSTPILNRAGATTGTITGVLRGVPVKITQESDTSYKIEQVSGTASVAVPARSVFLTDDGERLRDRHVILWPFRNSVTPGATYYEDPWVVASLVRQTIDHLSTRVKQVMVFECLPAAESGNGLGEELGTAARANLDAANAIWRQALAEYWVPLLPWMQSAAAATAAGITFTSADLTDIQNGLVPRSFRADSLHPNGAGNIALKEKAKSESIARGWR